MLLFSVIFFWTKISGCEQLAPLESLRPCGEILVENVLVGVRMHLGFEIALLFSPISRQVEFSLTRLIIYFCLVIFQIPWYLLFKRVYLASFDTFQRTIHYRATDISQLRKHSIFIEMLCKVPVLQGILTS